MNIWHIDINRAGENLRVPVSYKSSSPIKFEDIATEAQSRWAAFLSKTDLPKQELDCLAWLLDCQAGIFGDATFKKMSVPLMYRFFLELRKFRQVKNCEGVNANRGFTTVAFDPPDTDNIVMLGEWIETTAKRIAADFDDHLDLLGIETAQINCISLSGNEDVMRVYFLQ